MLYNLFVLNPSRKLYFIIKTKLHNINMKLDLACYIIFQHHYFTLVTQN